MSITPQRLRTNTGTKSLIKTGNWSKCFPTKFSTETSSCTFVKKLLTVAVSNITYLRSMFPEQAYANRSMDGLALKILRGKNECPDAQSLANWLMGAFDALERKYLRELMLMVYKDKANPDIVEEIYTFQFSYPDGQATCQLLQGEEGKEVKNITDDDIYKSTQNLLRTLIVLTQGMSPLTDSMMTMKLTYYDDVTPADYEPAGFLPTPLVEPQLPAGSVVLQSGQVSTLYHSVSLGVRAVSGQAPAGQQGHVQESVQANQTQKSYTESNNLKKAEVMSCDLPSASEHQSVLELSQAPSSVSLLSNPSPSHPPSSVRSHLGLPTPQSQYSLAPSSVSLLSEKSEQDTNVHCLCSNAHPDPIMLECHLCSYQQHAACYRIISVDNIPTKHCCVSCSIKHGVPCTDAKLVKMSSNPAVANTCLFRRVLYLLLQVESVNLELVAERLGVDEGTAEAVVNKVGKEGCLEDDQVEGQWRVLSQVVVSNMLPKYIGRKKTSKAGCNVEGSQGEVNSVGAGDNAAKKERGSQDVAKCSVVAGSAQVPKYEAKRIHMDEEGTRRRNSKRRKVSEVKGNLQI